MYDLYEHKFPFFSSFHKEVEYIYIYLYAHNGDSHVNHKSHLKS